MIRIGVAVRPHTAYLSATLFVAVIFTTIAIPFAPASGDRLTAAEPDKGKDTDRFGNSRVPSEPPGTSPPAGVSGAPRSVTVYGLSAVSVDGRVVGGNCFPIRVTVGGGRPGETRIGFFESDVSAHGEQWRSAGWMAALAAAQLTDFHPLTRQVAFDVGGRIDGPSAGGLLTVAVVAAARGDQVRADTTMTGTINPDGMIGPVGGLVHKIRGAARAGKKTVLVPAGLTREYDPQTKKVVDLIRLGRELGVEVRTVGDIYDAYRQLTGIALPVPARAPLPAPSDTMVDRLQASMDRWRRRRQAALTEFNRFDLVDEYAEELAEESDAIAEDAEYSLREGKVGTAWSDMLYAAIEAYIASEEVRTLYEQEHRGQSGALARLRNNGWLQREVEQTGTALKYFRPHTMSELSMYLMACHTFLEGVAYQHLAQQKLRRLPQDVDEAEQQLLLAGEWQLVAWLDMKLVQDQLALIDSLPGMAIPRDLDLDQLTSFFRKTAAANEKAFESLILQPFAKRKGIGAAAAAAAIGEVDEYIAVNSIGEKVIRQVLDQHFPSGRQRQLATLGWQMFRHHRASMLLAKYYSLDADLDEDLAIVGLKRESAVDGWLDRSLDVSQRKIAELERRGLDVSTLSVLHEIAQVYSRKSDLDKLDALETLFELNCHLTILNKLSH